MCKFCNLVEDLGHSAVWIMDWNILQWAVLIGCRGGVLAGGAAMCVGPVPLSESPSPPSIITRLLPSPGSANLHARCPLGLEQGGAVGWIDVRTTACSMVKRLRRVNFSHPTGHYI